MNELAEPSRPKPRPARFAALAAREVLALAGVKKMRPRISDWLWLHKRPGISVTIDDYGRLHADVAIIAKLGWDLPDLGRRVQFAVYNVIRKHTDLPIGEIHVTIAGVKEESRITPTHKDLSP